MFALLARRRAYTASRNVSSFLRRTYSDRIIRSKPAMQDFAMGIQLTRFLRPSLISRCSSADISAACVTRRLLGRPDGFGYGVNFFSSRRRHPSLQGDWSSDVCSSDLQTGDEPGASLAAIEQWRKALDQALAGRC